MMTEPYELTISLPAKLFTPEQIENLRSFASANDALLREGLPAVSTDIIVDGDKVSFPWFEQTGSAADQVKFISNLAKRIRSDDEAPTFTNFAENEEWVNKAG